jgi:hypothetical protein
MYRFRCVSENSNNSLWWRIYVITHFYVGYVYVIYYFAIITSVMMPRGDPSETNWPCLRARHHSWCQSFMGVIHHVWPYFRKHAVRKRLDAHIRTIVVLTSGKLTVFKLCNYGKVMVWFFGLFWIILLFMKLILLLVNICRTSRTAYAYFVVYALFSCLWTE